MHSCGTPVSAARKQCIPADFMLNKCILIHKVSISKVRAIDFIYNIYFIIYIISIGDNTYCHKVMVICIPLCCYIHKPPYITHINVLIMFHIQ